MAKLQSDPWSADKGDFYQPLALTRAVCQARPELVGHPGIVRLFDAFLDHSVRWANVLDACFTRMGLWDHIQVYDNSQPWPGTSLYMLQRIQQRTAAHHDALQDDVDTRDFGLAMEWACRNGRFDLVRFLHEYAPSAVAPWAMCAAAHGGHLEIIQWLHNNRPNDDSIRPTSTMNRPCATPLDWAAHNGHLEVVQWLHDNAPTPCTPKAMHDAAANGHVHVLEWLYEHRREGGCDGLTIDRAAENGHLAAIQWLVSHGFSEHSTDVATRGADTGSVELVRYLHEQLGAAVDNSTLAVAVGTGSLDLAQYLHGIVPDQDTEIILDEAILSGNLELVQWLQQNSPRPLTCTPDAFDRAARLESPAILLWLCENYGHVLVDRVKARLMFPIASKGDVDLIRRLCDEFGFPIFPGLAVAALEPTGRKDHHRDLVPMLRWLRERSADANDHDGEDAGWTNACVDTAAAGGHIRELEWFHKDCGLVGTTSGVKSACKRIRYHPECKQAVRYYLEHFRDGIEWTEVIEDIIALGDARLLSEVCEATEATSNKVVFKPEALQAAATSGFVGVLSWLDRHPRSPGFDGGMLHAAAVAGAHRSVAWWYEHRPERCDHDTVVQVIRAGHRQVLDIVLAGDLGHIHDPLGLFAAAITRGDRRTLRHLARRFPCVVKAPELVSLAGDADKQDMLEGLGIALEVRPGGKTTTSSTLG